MKVRDLLETLQAADPDLDIFVSPLAAYPSFNEDEQTIIADPFQRYQIGTLTETREMVGERLRYMVIGYDTTNIERMRLVFDEDDDSAELVN